NKVDTENVEPLYQTTGLVNSVRKDEYRKDFELDDPVRSLARAKGTSPKDLGEATSYGINAKLIGQAPDSQNRFIKVKSVLNK
ncbi:MAG: Asp-tRNA(Asn)/Glu-tRNA(Gln) amidotransferase subunit GatC, partial [Candidatus Taylorbacteria bacterium]|nr:Asp-tRNA(Asn)/Glu-tRNA(Gln) amidotransferase subunit GatC [Candidatus Taylorbacteria bacterium]